MDPFRVLIADDEPPARRKLRDLLAGEHDFVVASEHADGASAVRALREEEVDLALLDVQMPPPTGPEVVVAVGPDRMPPTVFVTAYDRYAVRAFELHAVDYLLKPLDRERFRATLARARRAIALRGSDHARRLRELVERLGARAPVEPIALRSGGRTLLVRPDEVEWIEAADNYVRLHGARGEDLVRGTLTAMEELLRPHGFLRVHRSLLVNERALRDLRPRRGGELELRLASGRRLVSGRAYRACLEERWSARRVEPRPGGDGAS